MVDALLTALPQMANVLMVGAVVFLIFGIMGMDLFMGAFDFCSLGTCCADAADDSTCQVLESGVHSV